MSTLFRSSMIAAVMISSAGLYGSEAMKKGGSEVEKGADGVDIVLYPGSGSPTTTPPASPDLSKGRDGAPRKQAFSPSPRSVPGCPPGLDEAYWAALAKKANEQLKAKASSEQKNGTPQ